MIVGLFPDLLSPGGVQRVGRHAAAVLAGCAAKMGNPYEFLSLKDPAGVSEIRVGCQGIRCRGFGRAKLPYAAAALRLATGRPQLVLAAHHNLASIAAGIRAIARKTRVLVLAHGMEVWQPLPWWLRRALRRADLVSAPSTYTARRLTQVQGVPAEKVRRLPWGLDPEADGAGAQPANCLPLGFPPGRVILTVGRLAANERYKGVDTLIQAVACLRARFRDVSLLIVGDGDDRPRLEALARKAALQESVFFLGALEGNALLSCYRQCHAFAMPSRGEGFGLVFLEAMAAGKAVVGGAHGGTPDIIEDGVTGYLVPHGDVGRLAEVLAKLLSDERLRLELGRKAKERVHTNYLFEHFQMGFAAIVEELCAS
jgi:glycosyltransferase involved in cell wall biosynthesis